MKCCVFLIKIKGGIPGFIEKKFGRTVFICIFKLYFVQSASRIFLFEKFLLHLVVLQVFL